MSSMFNDAALAVRSPMFEKIILKALHRHLLRRAKAIRVMATA